MHVFPALLDRGWMLLLSLVLLDLQFITGVTLLAFATVCCCLLSEVLLRCPLASHVLLCSFVVQFSMMFHCYCSAGPQSVIQVAIAASMVLQMHVFPAILVTIWM
jgi:hypothetical protein